MWWILWTSLAYADANEVLARQEQPLRERRYAQLTQTQPPRGRYRSRRGRFRVWSWPDGTIEHLEERERGVLVRRQRFNPSGTAISTVIFREKQPHHAILHGPSAEEVDLSRWVPWALEGVRFSVPESPDEAGLLTLPNGTVRVMMGPETDVFSDGVRDALLKVCGCVVEDRSAFWAAGQVGVRYRLHFPHPERPQTGETWVLPTQNGRTLYIAAIVQAVTSDPGALATPRAMVSLLTLEPPP